MKDFDPMHDIPETEEQVLIALQREDRTVTANLIGIFQCEMAQGKSLLEAYRAALRRHVQAGRKAGLL